MMSRKICKVNGIVWFVMVLLSLAGLANAADYLSPLDIVASSDGKTLYVAEATAHRIDVVDVAGEKVVNTISLRQNPTALAISPDGRTLYATAGTVHGKVCRIDLASGKVVGVSDVGYSPSDVVVSPDGGTLYVCNRFDNNISIVDVASGKTTATVGVSREPVAAALSADGGLLFVANMLPAGRADGNYSASVVSVVDTAAKKVISDIVLPNGSMALRDITVSPDGKYAYLTHILARYQLPTTQLERGWINTNALSVIDVSAKKLVNTVLLDNVDLGAANPWSVACSADGKSLCVTLAGTYEVAVIDRVGMHEKLEKVARGEKVSDASASADDVPNDLAFLVGLKKRIKLDGNGPRGLAIVGSKVYAAEYFSDTLGVADIYTKAQKNTTSINLGPSTPMTLARKGEMFFHDADLCFQKWQSCSSCHPGDGRADAMNWDLLNDGLGNPKNTKSLLLAHKTPPAMVTGIRASTEVAVRAGIRYIQFAVRPEEDAVAIDEYLKSLTPLPSPYLEDGGKLSGAAERGQKIFVKAGCMQCHSGSLYTNMEKYNVGLGLSMEKDIEFDTSSLVEIWRTAPYLHDGRAATMREVLTVFNQGDRHGKTSNLSEKEIDDLVEFVLSL
jgi:YVTN family beta-propeller protein